MSQEFKKILLEKWEIIKSSVQTKDVKFFRFINLNTNFKVRASIRGKDGLKSVEFLFLKKFENQINFKTIETKGIKVTKEFETGFESEFFICIYLKSESFLEIYLEFIEKILIQFSEINDDIYGLKLLINKINIWVKFFESENYEGLSEEQIRGLFSELSFILKIFNLNSNYEKVIKSWAGPEHGLHDFKFEHFNVEIKSYAKSKKIRISILDQIDIDEGLVLYLSCFMLNKVSTGKSLNDLVNEIKNLITNNQKIYNLFLEKISNIGYFDIHKNFYEENYLIEENNIYLVNNNFPRVVKKNLHEAISNVSYSIAIDSCSDFLVEEKNFYTNTLFQ